MAGKRLLSKSGWWVMPLVVSAIVALDQFTKYLVIANLGLHESWAPIPALAKWLRFYHITNTGAAFGLFQDGKLFFVVVAIIVSVAILLYYRTLPGGQWLVRLSLGMQLGGALGNLIDRLLRQGRVVDFISVPYWPVFNVADSSITVGVLVLVLMMVREEWAERTGTRAFKGAGSVGGQASPG